MMSKGGLLERKEEEGKRSVFLMVFFSFVEIPSIIKRKRKSPLAFSALSSFLFSRKEEK